MSEMSKMVFAALTQRCIQSTHFMSEMLEILYSVYSGPSGGVGYLFEPSALWV